MFILLCMCDDKDTVSTKEMRCDDREGWANCVIAVYKTGALHSAVTVLNSI